MNQLAGYWVKELIYEGTRTLVYRGVDRQNSLPVILKKLRKEDPTFNELLQFRHQYVITKNLDVPGIVKPLNLEKDGNGYVLVMEDVGGISLSQYYRERSLSLEEFFPVAIALGKILSNLYQYRIIHKDIKPSNILINPETKEIFLIDFSIASLLPRETQTLQSIGQLEGTLAYISPEQTGRTNRGIDYRSDFYGLGVTFYELLAGQLPFNSDDAMELVHCHIAKMPPALGKRQEARGNRAEEIPGVLSALVLKLMAKTPEERYQSAAGIERDLTECWQQWQTTGKVSHFELGRGDKSDRFGVPEKLYGRETEVQTLLKAFDRVAAGTTEMMLVTGFSGIGKTAAVNEVRKPIVKQRGYFIKGKFDQFQRNIPLSGFLQALRDWVEQLLGESEARLAAWREQILGALGERGRVILEVIPDLEKIVGEQPTVAELSGSAAVNRFNLVFGKFMGAIATKEHPLVMFLDDLQWADAASLKLMETLMGDRQGRCLFLVGTYRDNEVAPAHPLMLTLDYIGKSGAKINTIALSPLSQTEIDALISDTLRCDRSSPLTELVYATAKGNPFFTNQLLKSLYEDGAIYFNFDTYMWQWEPDKIRGLSLADDAVEFMASRISKLPGPTLEVLQLAACIGNRFDLATLAIVSEQSPAETAARLWPALQEGLVLPLDENYKFYQESEEESTPPLARGVGGAPMDNSPFPKYKFLHDRVQQAAYSLIPENRSSAIHLKIGKRLFQELDEAELSEKIFDVVNHFNLGQKSFEDESEKEQLAQLNFQAGVRAKSSTAYASAARYFTICTELLGEEGWQQRYELTFSAHKELAASQFLIGNFAASLMLIELAKERARELVERAEISSLKIVQLTMESRYSEAIEAGLDALAMLGINLRVSRSDTERQEEEGDLQLAIQREMAEIEQQLNGREVADLLELPEMTVPEIKAIVKLLIDLDPPTYITSQLNLYGLINVKAVGLSREYGNCQESVKAYANYGFILGYLQGKYQLGYQFGSLALKLSDKLKTATQKCKACLEMGGWIYVWSQPIKGAAEINLEGFKSGLEAGEIQFAGYNVFARISNLMFQGCQVQLLREEIGKYWSFAEKTQNQLLVETLTGMEQFVIALENTPSVLAGFGESEFVARCQSSQSFFGLCLYYIFKMQLSCIYGKFNEGLKYAVAAKEILESIQGCTTFAEYGYYASLILLNLEDDVCQEEATKLIEEVKVHQQQLQVWAESCPENFSCMYFLVRAEIHRRGGQKLEAMECYDRAISAAKENGFIHQEALANEFAAKFYLQWGKEKIPRAYLVDAYYAYADWGAVGKLKDLERRYPLLLASILTSPTTPLTSTIASTASSSSNSVSTFLDWTTAIKSSQVISQVLALEELLSKLMETLMQNAGASKGVLLLSKADTLVIEAIANYPEESSQTIEVTAAGRSVPLESNEELPKRDR
jgi:protein kinase